MKARLASCLAAISMLACGCASSPLRLDKAPSSAAEKSAYYQAQRVVLDGDDVATVGGIKFSQEKLSDLFIQRGDPGAARALEFKPYYIGMGTVLAAICVAGAWGTGTAGKPYGKDYNPFEAVPVVLCIAGVDASLTLAVWGGSSPRRAADMHNQRLQQTLGIDTEEGRYAPEYGRWWWRIPALLLVGSAYTLGRLPSN